MMVRIFVAAAVLLCAVCAQPAQPDGVQPDAPVTPGIPPEAVMAYVQQEEMSARKYLEVMLKLQRSQATMQAASYWIQELALEHKEDNMQQSFLEVETARPRAFEEDEDEENVFFDRDVRQNQEFEDNNYEQAKLDLLAVYNLFRAINIRNYETVFMAGDVQREFFMDRALQLSVQSGGSVEGMPPQLLQAYYLKMYHTMLKTLRLSYAFQYLSHTRTWLEDEIDIDTTILERGSDIDAILDDAADDLAREKLYAFHAYHSFAGIDLQIFYIDMYLEYIFMAMTQQAQPQPDGQQQQQAPPAASFLETEAEAEAEPAQSQFLPFMAYNANPMLYLRVYKFYSVYMQQTAASAGYQSAMFEYKSMHLLTDDIESNDEDGEKYKTSAQHMFGVFAHSLQVESQLEYMTSMFEIYAMYAPAIQGSLGGSMNGGSVGSV